MDISFFAYFIFLCISIGIYGIIALGLSIQWHFSGLFNIGIVGFFGIGAYTSALLTSSSSLGFNLPIIVGWIGAVFFSVLAAYPIGKICLRFRGDYLALCTIGMASIIYQIIKTEDWLTGGPRGITPIPRPFGQFSYETSQYTYLLLVLLLVGGLYWFVERLRLSPWGRMMRAIRDNEVAAEAFGKNITKHRLEAFMIGSGIMGLAGAVFVHFQRSVTPEALNPMMISFLTWIMIILGGGGNAKGPLLGAALIWLLWSGSELLTGMLPPEYAIQAQYLRLFLVGLALQFVLRYRPQGIVKD